MAGTVSMAGLVSNTNWTALIDDMINAQKSATVTPLQNSKTKYQTKLTAWQTFNTKLSTLTNYIDDNNLNENTGYALYSSSLYSSDASVNAASVLSASLGTVSGPGKYRIEVSALAQAEKISSDAFVSSTSELGLSGDILVNNKVVTLSTTDTLSTVTARINNANAGVTATVLTVSPTEYRLLLEATTTGSAGMFLKNGGASDLLQSLNLQTAAEQLTHPSGSDALGDTFRSKTTTMGSLLNLTASQSGTIRIQGTDLSWTDVAVDLGTDSLQGIADKINLAAPVGVTASVDTVTVNGVDSYRLKLTNVSYANVQDDKNILETLGIVGSTNKNPPLRTGQDASLTIDDFPITSPSNTIATAISGVTLNLLGTNVGKPIELRIDQSNSQVTQKVSALVSGLNDVLNYIKDQNTYNADADSTNSDSAKPLIGDPSLALVKSTISSAIFSGVDTNTVYKTAASIGINYQKDGTITLNSSTFSTALATNRDETISVLKAVNRTLYDNLKAYVNPITGTLAAITTSIQGTMSRIDTRISEFNVRYDRQRITLENKFNSLELLISQSNTTKSWLTQQVDAMTKK